MAAMRVALRVLTAITDQRHPDQADVELLRQYVQMPVNTPLDELACEVVDQARKGWIKAHHAKREGA